MFFDFQRITVVFTAAFAAATLSSCMQNGFGCGDAATARCRTTTTTSTTLRATTTTLRGTSTTSTTRPAATTTTTTTSTTSPPATTTTTVPPASVPPPNHALDFGYYYSDGRYGDYTSEVFPFTNLQICFTGAYDSAASWDNPDPTLNKALLFKTSLEKAFNNGKNIELLAGPEAEWDRMLDIAAPYWSRVKYMEMFAESPSVTAATAEATVNRMIAKLDARSLRHPLFGAMESPQAETAPNIDFVGIEAYVEVARQNDSNVVQRLNDIIDARKASVSGGRRILIIMQAYDRNFTWTNIETLKQVQYPAYMKSYNDPRVVALTMFAYARGGGSRAHPELKAIHQTMGAQILPVSMSMSRAVNTMLAFLGWRSPGEYL